MSNSTDIKRQRRFVTQSLMKHFNRQKLARCLVSDNGMPGSGYVASHEGQSIKRLLTQSRRPRVRNVTHARRNRIRGFFCNIVHGNIDKYTIYENYYSQVSSKCEDVLIRCITSRKDCQRDSNWSQSAFDNADTEKGMSFYWSLRFYCYEKKTNFRVLSYICHCTRIILYDVRRRRWKKRTNDGNAIYHHFYNW